MTEPDTLPARRETPPPGTVAAHDRLPVDLTSQLADLDAAYRVAVILSQSSIVPRACQGNPANCLVFVMSAQELDLSWAQAVRGLYMTPAGGLGLRGTLLLAKIRMAGHKYKFEHGDDYCTCTITRKDENFETPWVGKFTLEDALTAGLVTRASGGNLIARSSQGAALPWEQYRKDMLKWRSVARAAVDGVPELIFGFDLAGTGDDGETVAASRPSGPAPGTGTPAGTPDDMQEKLRLLDLQRTAPGDAATVETPEGEDDTLAGAPASGADYEVPARESGNRTAAGPRPGGAPSARGAQAPPPPAPTVRGLAGQLRKLRLAGDEQADAVSVLVHRRVSVITDLTQGEALMVSNSLGEINAKFDEKDRPAALQDLLNRERDAWGEEDQ